MSSTQAREPRAQVRVVPPGGGGTVIGPGTGFGALEQSVLEVPAGGSVACARSARGDADEEVLFVVAGAGVLRSSGVEHALEPEGGVVLPPGESYELGAGPAEALRVVAVRVPDPGGAPEPPSARPLVRRLADQEAQDATAEREFRIVADPASGLRSATHFVGYIPRVRAPDHFHAYDEVIYVLDGEGVLHAGGDEHPVTAGSSIQLPARAVHCLENTGGRVMRVVAVFRPAGSPAAAYYPDGSPAYAAEGSHPQEEER